MAVVPFHWCLILLAIAVPAMAQKPEPSASWDDVRKIAPGRNVEVRGVEGQAVKGQLQSVEESQITVRKGATAITTARDMVREVRLRTGRTRLQKTGIGAAVGAGTSFAFVVIALYATGSSFSSDDAPELVSGFTIWGTGVGAAVGALLPVKWKTVYRRAAATQDKPKQVSTIGGSLQPQPVASSP